MNFKELLQKEPVFLPVIQSLKELQAEGYIIGGFVRDLLLDRTSKDIDFVCIGDGTSWAEHIAKQQNIEPTIFKNYGTAQLKMNGWELEFVGARKESYTDTSRNPTIEIGTLFEDQNRRDFTINTLSISLNETNLGELIDPFSGIEDLEKKIIRTPLDPKITFSDDPLRMMRGIRLASQLGFDIEAHTFEAIQSEKERIKIVSKERIIDELNKIILSPKPSYGFKLLDSAGLLELIFPEFMLLKGVEYQDNKGHKDNFYHTLQVLDNISKETNDLWLRWAALLHDIAKPATKKFDKKQGWTFHGHEDLGARMVPSIFRRMKLPMHDSMKSVQNIVRLHLRPIVLAKEEITDSALRRLLADAGDDLEGLFILCRADITSKKKELVQKYLENFRIVEKKIQEVEERDKIRNFQPAITGEFIMKRFNLVPSPEVGKIKIELREAVLDGKIKNSIEEGLEYLDSIAEKYLPEIRK